MMARTARLGRVEWIGIRSERRAAVAGVASARVTVDGIEGDHARAGKRAVTLIQAEHLPVVAALLDRATVDPADLRRNIVVSGLNLAGFRKAALDLGSVRLHITGPCPPCSRMEEVLGFGGYTAMRGHGGYYAEVVTAGEIREGDAVTPA